MTDPHQLRSVLLARYLNGDPRVSATVQENGAVMLTLARWNPDALPDSPERADVSVLVDAKEIASQHAAATGAVDLLAALVKG